MNVLDIILAIPLLWAIYKGFRDGIVVQLGGLAGLFVGVYLAFRFGSRIGELLNLDSSVASIVGFIIILVITIIAVAIVGRLLSGLFRFAGLGILDQIGGSLLSLLKAGLIVGLLLYGFDSLNRSEGWIKEEKITGSVLYKPLTGMAKFAFPYMDMVKDKLLFNPDGEE